MRQILLLLAALTCISAEFLRYEAELAHHIGSKSIKQLNGHSNNEYVSFEHHDENTRKIIFTVNSDSDESYPLAIRAKSKLAKLEVHANGYYQDTMEVSTGTTWSTSKTSVQLRWGLNSVVFLVSGNETFELDFIDIYGTIPLASRGATLPFVEYEAEAATHNGVVIGPGRDYMTLPSEASGRMAVQLNQGQYVEFVLKAPANGASIRFSIPDSKDGKGLSATLSMTIDGTAAGSLNLTSHYSWAYGTYPFTKNPGDGLPHHFYDEIRIMFPGGKSAPANSKVRFTSATSGIVITIDLADFHVIPAPYSAPDLTKFVSVMDHGADPSGKKDSTQAINNAILFAESNSKTGVWIPQGTFLVNTRFTYTKLIVRGAGPWYTTVKATANHGVGFFGNWPQKSENQLYDFTISGDTNVRDDSAIDSGAGGALENAMIQNVWIEHTKCGMWLDGPFNGLHALGLVIINTYADGVNFHVGITNSVIEQSLIRNTGDDGLAMWSQNSPDASNVFRFNTIQCPVLANGIAIYGGHDNSATDNYIADTICEGGGLQASNRFGAVPLAGTTTFTRNTLVRTGSPNRPNSAHNGAMWFWAGDSGMTGNVEVTHIDMMDSSFAGITFWGSSMNNINFDSLNIHVAPYAAEVVGLNGVATFTNTVATGLTNGGIFSCDPSFVIKQGANCTGWSDVHCQH